MESQKDGSKVSFQVLIEPNYSNVISLEYTVVVSCWSVPMRKKSAAPPPPLGLAAPPVPPACF
jgi:hypothetical protein